MPATSGSGKNSRNGRNAAKSTRQGGRNKKRIFRTFTKFAENKAKMYCLVLKIEDNVQISEKREDSRNSHMK